MVEFRRSLAASFLFRFVVHANYALAVRCSPTPWVYLMQLRCGHEDSVQAANTAYYVDSRSH
jgi:hypothetical protein